MAGFSDFVERGVLRLFRGTAFAAASAMYLGLHNGDPGDAGTAVPEISGNAYARTVVTWKDVASSGDPGALLNNGAVTCPTATPLGWGLITHVSLWDAVTAGNMWASGAMAASKTVGAGDTLRFPDSNISLTID